MIGSLLTLSLSAAVATATPPSPEQAIEAALTRCLDAPFFRTPEPSDPTLRPPGLIEGVQTSVSPIDGTAGRAFAYEGTNPRFGSCGIALYGAEPRSTRRHIASIISTRYHASSDIGAWDLTKRSVAASEQYYGISLAGVALLTRKRQQFAPTLEVEYHSILVQ